MWLCPDLLQLERFWVQCMETTERAHSLESLGHGEIGSHEVIFTRLLVTTVGRSDPSVIYSTPCITQKFFQHRVGDLEIDQITPNLALDAHSSKIKLKK
jgi:hypothetical protein